MSDSVTPSPTPQQEAKPSGKVQKLLVKAGIALGLALVFFLIGWFVARGPVGELRERTESAESSLALMQDHLHMTEATSLLYQTALDLDARNFGTANDRLDEAAASLQRVGVVGSEMESLRSSVAGMDINVAQDLAGQRASVLGFAEALQALLPSIEAAPLDTTGTAD